MVVPTESFGDVSRAGAGGVEDLIAEIEIVPSARVVDQCVHFKLQLIRQLPTLEILVLVDGHAGATGNTRAV